MEGALWCHIITLLCAAGDWISGWAGDRERKERRRRELLYLLGQNPVEERHSRAKSGELFSGSRGGGGVAAASLLPFVCLSGALSWPLQDHAAAWLIEPVEGILLQRLL